MIEPMLSGPRSVTRTLARLVQLCSTDSLASRRFLILAVMLAVGLTLALFPLPWILVAVPGLVVVGLALVRPQVALYLLCLAIPFGSLFEVDLGGITVGVTEGLIGLLIVAWIASHVERGPNGQRSAFSGQQLPLEEMRQHMPPPSFTGPLPLGCALSAFIGAALLSLPNAISLPLALKEIAKWIEFLGVMLFVAHAVTRKQSRAVVASLLLAGVGQALLGAYQFLTRSGPEFFALGRFMRAYGTFEQPNPYGGYLGLIAPLALALALSPLRRTVSGQLSAASYRPTSAWGADLGPRWLAWLALGSFAVVSVAIGMSASRGAWLAFGAAFVVVNVAQSRKGAAVFVTLILLAVLIGLLGTFRLLPMGITQRLTGFLSFVDARDVRSVEVTDANYASLERLAFWQAALDMWRDHPWLGVGFGNYQAAYPLYSLPKWRMALGHAHNYYLNVAAETGLIGLVAYLALCGTALWQTLRVMRASRDPYARALALGALGVLVHVGVHSVVDNLWVHNMYIHVAIILGLAQSRSITFGSTRA